MKPTYTSMKPTCDIYRGCDQTENLINLSCYHSLCGQCLKNHAINELQAGRREIVCPTMVCDVIIADQIIRSVLKK